MGPGIRGKKVARDERPGQGWYENGTELGDEMGKLTMPIEEELQKLAYLGHGDVGSFAALRGAIVLEEYCRSTTADGKTNRVHGREDKVMHQENVVRNCCLGVPGLYSDVA